MTQSVNRSNKNTIMENIIISIKKDVNRSPYHQYELNTCHFKGQHSRTGVDTVNHSVANYLSGTKFDKKDKFANNLSKKIDNWDKNPISGSKDESNITEVFDGIFKGVDRNVPTDTEFKTIR